MKAKELWKISEPMPPAIEPNGMIQTYRGKDGLLYTFDENGKSICGAERKKVGTPCRHNPVPGKNRCKYHGGASPRGIAAPRFKDGKYSRDLASRNLAERYEEARNDEELLSLRDEIAVIEARLGELLQRSNTGESSAVWNELRSVYSKMRTAVANNDQKEFADQLNRMGRLIQQGRDDYRAWEEVFRAISQRRRLVETERKRLVEMKQLMTAEQAQAMLSFVVATVKKHVTDVSALANISADINARLMNRTPGGY